MHFILSFALALLLPLPPIAFASLDKGKTHWLPVGQATLSVLFWDIYDASLYSDTGTFNQINGPLKLELNYFRNISQDEIIKETEKQWRKLKKLDQANKHWLTLVGPMFPDIKKGDQLSFTLQKDNSALLHFNQELIAKLEPSQSNSDFLAIWLSAQSSFPQVTKRLTGQ
jgi:hypothetical protein